MSYRVIGKGRLKPDGADGLVSPGRYLLIQENGRRFLLPEFVCGGDKAADGVQIKLTQKDRHGKICGKTTFQIPFTNGKSRGSVIPGYKIPLTDACADFTVRANKPPSADYE